MSGNAKISWKQGQYWVQMSWKCFVRQGSRVVPTGLVYVTARDRKRNARKRVTQSIYHRIVPQLMNNVRTKKTTAHTTNRLSLSCIGTTNSNILQTLQLHLTTYSLASSECRSWHCSGPDMQRDNEALMLCCALRTAIKNPKAKGGGSPFVHRS